MKHNPLSYTPDEANAIAAVLSDPFYWLQKGEDLYRSARLLFEHEMPIGEAYYAEVSRGFAARGKTDEAEPFSYDWEKFPPPNFGAAFLLAGFSAENYLKGMLIASGAVTYDTAKLPKPLNCHDLYKLQKEAKATTSLPRHILEYLSSMAIWEGRYPLPINVDHLRKFDENGKQIANHPEWDAPLQILKYLEGLHQELKQQVHEFRLGQERKNRPPMPR
jgi:hypothetical protein